MISTSQKGASIIDTMRSWLTSTGTKRAYAFGAMKGVRWNVGFNAQKVGAWAAAQFTVNEMTRRLRTASCSEKLTTIADTSHNEMEGQPLLPPEVDQEKREAAEDLRQALEEADKVIEEVQGLGAQMEGQLELAEGYTCNNITDTFFKVGIQIDQRVVNENNWKTFKLASLVQRLHRASLVREWKRNYQEWPKGASERISRVKAMSFRELEVEPTESKGRTASRVSWRGMDATHGQGTRG